MKKIKEIIELYDNYVKADPVDNWRTEEAKILYLLRHAIAYDKKIDSSQKIFMVKMSDIFTLDHFVDYCRELEKEKEEVYSRIEKGKEKLMTDMANSFDRFWETYD